MSREVQTSSIETRIRREVIATLLPAGSQASVASDDDLLAIFDSLQLLRLAVGVESTFGIRIDNSELTADNVGTLERLSAFVSSKTDRARS